MKLSCFLYICMSTVLLQPSPLSAQNDSLNDTVTSTQKVLSPSTKNDQSIAITKAKDDLKLLLNALKTYKAQFKQLVVDGQGELLQESIGYLVLKQPNLMLWNVIEPDENRLIADGETLWYVDPFVEQVTAVHQAQSVANNPVVLLTDPENDSWQDFDIRYINNEYVIEAIKPESHIARLVLNFDETGTLSGLRFTDRQEQKSELVFSDIQQNLAVSSDMFIFSLPEGFEMDDQR